MIVVECIAPLAPVVTLAVASSHTNVIVITITVIVGEGISIYIYVVFRPATLIDIAL